MQEVIQFLNENPVQYLATVGRDGKAKCRPFMFAGEKDGKLWFCTNNTKEVYQDMLMNPNVELSVALSLIHIQMCIRDSYDGLGKVGSYYKYFKVENTASLSKEDKEILIQAQVETDKRYRRQGLKDAVGAIQMAVSYTHLRAARCPAAESWMRSRTA